jgi:hypothetical protein
MNDGDAFQHPPILVSPRLGLEAIAKFEPTPFAPDRFCRFTLSVTKGLPTDAELQGIMDHAHNCWTRAYLNEFDRTLGIPPLGSD